MELVENVKVEMWISTRSKYTLITWKLLIAFSLIRSKHKIFLTEEKLIRNMQTLSLDLSVDNSTSIPSNSQDDQ